MVPYHIERFAGVSKTLAVSVSVVSPEPEQSITVCSLVDLIIPNIIIDAGLDYFYPQFAVFINGIIVSAEWLTVFPEQPPILRVIVIKQTRSAAFA